MLVSWTSDAIHPVLGKLRERSGPRDYECARLLAFVGVVRLLEWPHV